MANETQLQQKLIEDYWLKALRKQQNTQEAHPALEDPTHREQASTTIPQALWERIQKVAQQDAAKEQVVWLSLMHFWLYKTFGARQAPVVVPPLQRKPSPHFAFVSLPELEATQPYKALLKQTLDPWRQAEKYRQYTQEQLHDLWQQREVSTAALYQYGLYVAHLNTTEPLHAHSNLLLEIHQVNGTPTATLQYNNQWFSAIWAQRAVQAYVQMAQALLAAASEPLNTFSLATTEEQNHLLQTFNPAPSTWPQNDTAVSLFEQQVQQQHTKTAAIYQEEQLSFAQLNESANRLAHWLIQEKKVKPGQAVALLCHRNLLLPQLIWGVLKAGAAYLPLDPQAPTERLALVLNDAQPALILTDDAAPAMPEGHQATTWSSLQTDLGQQPSQNPATPLQPEHPAYIIYTSGSTGVPKGVVLPHQALLCRLAGEQEIYGHGPHTVTCHALNYTFDASLFDLFLAPTLGGTLVIPDHHSLYDAPYMLELWQKHGVNTVHSVPVFLALMARIIEAEPAKYPLKDLKFLTTGGESLQDSLLAQLKALIPHVAINNMYGPTEAALGCVLEKDVQQQETDLIGQPMPNTTMLLLDEDGQLVPPGFAGELYIGGPGLAIEYLNSADLTQERFITNPFAAELANKTPGFEEKLYRSGDMGYWTPQGKIAFLGRKDQQIKVRGYRIEIGEIEQALLKHSQIDEVAVSTYEDSEGVLGLIAYITSNEIVTAPDLQDFLKQHLPEYMVPALFALLPAMPITESGKINRQALPEPAKAPLLAGKPFVAPTTETEKMLVSIFEEVLERPKLGIKDDFFENGGHSLKATRTLTRVFQESGARITLRHIFENPTPETLAKVVESAESVKYQPMQPATIQAHYPLSNAQRRLWVLDQLEENQTAYNIPEVQVFQGNVDPAVLEKTFMALLERHESLRTTFKAVEGTPRQFVQEAQQSGFALAVQNLQSHAAEAAGQAAQEAIAQEANTPFDLENGPLVRAKLLQLPQDQSLVLFTMHHIISDGWSMQVLRSEVTQLYQAFVQQQENPLPALPIQYKDYTVWLETEMASQAFVQHKEYWHHMLGQDRPVLDLPADFQRPVVKTYNGATAAINIGHASSLKLQTLARQTQISPFMLWTGLIATLLYRYTGKTDMILGTTVAGREHGDLEGQIGFYVNTLALRISFEHNQSFTALAEKIKVLVLEAFEHQLYPFDKLVNELDLERDTSRTPLFDVLINMNNDEGSQVESFAQEATATQANEGTVVHGQESAVSKFDLTFNLTETPTGYTIGLNYNTDLYTQQRIARMLEHLYNISQAIAQKAAHALHEVPMLSQEEVQRQLYTLNAAPTEYQRQTTIHQQVEAQVKATPQNIALAYESLDYTYEQVNQKANQLAHWLQTAYKAEPDQLIGVLLDRSERMVITLLAILKAGAAYVPIDPNYPEERINYMLQDTGVTTLVVDNLHLVRTYKLEHLNIVHLLEQKQQIEGQPIHNPESSVQPHHLAYIIYTSGSTGQPKGIAIEHRNTLAMIAWAHNEYDQSPWDTVFATTTYCFDMSVFEIFYTLTTGRKVRVLGSGLDIVHNLDRPEKILIDTVPSVIEGLVKEQVDLSRVTVLNMGGEAIKMSLKNALDYQRMEVRNLYGPSEDTTFSSCYRFVPEHSIMPVGKAIDNTQFYVLDAQGQLMPEGAYGEIALAGEGITRGYLNKPELTAQKFVPNPFYEATQAGAFAHGQTLYRTGDIGRWMPDGNMEYAGRMDHQIKIRGFRVEAGEIENRLQEHAKVDKAVVVAHDDKDGIKQLVAYITTKGQQEVSVPELRGHLKALLPDYMVPSYFAVLDSIPLNANGKVDRKALPDPEGVGMGPQADYVAPETDLQKQMVAIWEEVLERKPIGIKDNFFDLGGHSLKATRLVARIYKELEWQISLIEIYNFPTIEALVNAATGATQHTSLSIKLSPIQSGRQNIFMLPPIVGIAAIYQGLAMALGNDLNSYGIQFPGFDLEGKPDKDLLQVAQRMKQEIQQVQPTGTFLLLGYSVGATLAFEIAKLLEAEGHETKLILLDRSTLNILKQKGRSHRKKILEEESANWLQGVPPKEARQMRKILLHKLKLMQQYTQQGSIKGPIMALEAGQNEDKTDMDLWENYTTGRFKYHYLKGNHYQVLQQENIPEIAEKIRQLLEQY